MKKYYPSYYDNFSCIAGECPDSCCRKWEIVIDKKTLQKYNNLNEDIREKIISRIVTNEEGDSCFSLKDGDCPFLNKNGLCDIHLKLGEDYTSEICRNHPRFIEEYDGFMEISLSLSCPEANRIILSSDVGINSYPAPFYDGDDEVLQLLIASREKVLSEKTDFFSLTKLLLDTAADDALDIDLVYIENHPEADVNFLKNFGNLILNESEILTDFWRTLVTGTVSSAITDNQLFSYIKSNSELLIKICHYFVYRYYLKAVNDLDIYSRALFIVIACYFSAFVSLSQQIKLSEAVRLFSKETEHNLFNLELMLKFFSKF